MRRWLLTMLAGVLGGSTGCSSQAPAEPTPASEATAPSEPPPPPQAPAACVPTSCALQHQTCGALADGCGATLTCGAACTTPQPAPPPSTSVCAGLMPEPVSPVSRDITTGLVRYCDREPALDGRGYIALSTDDPPGYHGISTWLLTDAKGPVRYSSFESNPSPRLWPQARGFQMISTLFSSTGSSYNSFQTSGGNTERPVEEAIGGEDNPHFEEVSSALDPTGGTVVAWLERVQDAATGENSVQVKVRRYDEAGRSRFGEAIVATLPESGSPSWPNNPLVVGTDTRGRTLVLWTEGDATSDKSSTVGRWLNTDGTPLTPIFPTQVPTPPPAGWKQPRWTLAPLIGGGLALQAHETLTHGFASGATQESPLPVGLAGRQGRLERGRGGRAYALLLPAAAKGCGRQAEILAPDGTSCGTLTFGAERCQNEPLVLGAEGSILQRQEFAQPVTNPEGEAYNGCTLTWWPGLLR